MIPIIQKKFYGSFNQINRKTPMQKVFNFNAGPAMLPEAVLLKAQEDMLNWRHTGMSMMEIGHRTDVFQQLVQQIEQNLRELMGVPTHYHVLFLAGGATLQFSMVPINLFTSQKKADYMETGLWSSKAIKEASKFGNVNIVAQAKKEDDLWTIPAPTEWQLSHDADYFHYTPNETITGLAFNHVPILKNIPLVADMTSMILSEPVNVNDFGLIYASAQKNLGQAGITLVIIREDLVKLPLSITPTLLEYATHVTAQSLYNTPPTYSWYILGLVLDWMKEMGGVTAIHSKNCRNAERLYDALDRSQGFYRSSIHPAYRSKMNVSFDLPNDDLLKLFLHESHASGLCCLKGHRAAGGVRASIYNAMPEEGVEKLVLFMDYFMQRFG